jgi:protein-tyrosine phosphatase
MIKVLFVCLGNICRSPMAEGILNDVIEKRGLKEKVLTDSAGTAAYHIGEFPDSRMRQTARQHGLQLTHRARQLRAEDLYQFDYILAMDRANLDDILKLSLMNQEEGQAKIMLLRDFDPQPGTGNVPDPYYGGQDGFEAVYQMLKRSIQSLTEFLMNESPERNGIRHESDPIF